jgi:hypothetical protein
VANQLKYESGRQVAIQGSVYTPGASKMMLAQLLSYLFIVGLALMFVGDWFFSSVVQIRAGQDLMVWMKKNQVVVIGGLFMCNFLAANMMNSGVSVVCACVCL